MRSWRITKPLLPTEVPEAIRENVHLDCQEIRLGPFGGAGSPHVKLTCFDCGAEVWKGVSRLRKLLREQPDHIPLCRKCTNRKRQLAKRKNVLPRWKPYVHFDKWEMREDKKGKEHLYVEVECSKCSRSTWFVRIETLTQQPSNPRKGNIKCRSCVGREFSGRKRRPRRRLLLPEEVNENFRRFCDFNQQVVQAAATGKKYLMIKTYCPECSDERWERVSQIRYIGRPAFCPTCVPIHRYRLGAAKLRADWRPFINFELVQQKDGDSGPFVVEVTCPKCNEPRWMLWQSISRMARLAPDGYLPYCSTCSAKTEHKPAHTVGEYTGYLGGAGYVQVKLKSLTPEDRLLVEQMYAHRQTVPGAIPGHRLKMAKFLKRPLSPAEQVHHRNGIRHDNRLANLRLVSSKAHPIAPNDKIAVLSVEIEALARELQTMQIDPLDALQQCFDALERMVDSTGVL